jgi:hypothetical protein
MGNGQRGLVKSHLFDLRMGTKGSTIGRLWVWTTQHNNSWLSGGQVVSPYRMLDGLLPAGRIHPRRLCTMIWHCYVQRPCFFVLIFKPLHLSPPSMWPACFLRNRDQEGPCLDLSEP